MFAARVARLFGLALALLFLQGGFVALGTAQDKKDEKKDEKKDTKKAKSKLKITVPQQDAVLTIEKTKTKLYGLVREFETPDLEVGKEYEYTFIVNWEPNNYTKMSRTK